MAFRIIQWLVVCSAIAVVMWLPFFFRGIKLGRTDLPWFLGLSLFLGSMLLPGMLVSAETMVSIQETDAHPVKTERLVALNDRIARETQGSFLLASGSVSSRDTYRYQYMVKSPEGNQVRSLDAESQKVYVNETLADGEEPTLVTKVNRWRNVRKLGVPDWIWIMVSPRTGWVTPDVLATRSYQFNVPADSVVSKFEVDLM